MIAEIICVGTEILMGQITNTNAQYIAQHLTNLGIDSYFQTVVGDNSQRLEDVLSHSLKRSDIIILTGGLGPTSDDITKDIVCQHFNLTQNLNHDILTKIQLHFQKIGRTMSPLNTKQALFPDQAIILENTIGTAPGMLLKQDDKTIILLPGPPHEMKTMWENALIPHLSKLSDGTLESRVLRFRGIGESTLEQGLGNLIENSKNPTLALYAKMGEVTLRITAKAKDSESCQQLINPIASQIYKMYPENIYAEGDGSIFNAVVERLASNKKTIATAESCTGGMLAAAITDIPGASNILYEGIVSYSNQSKISRLGVSSDTIERYGAVSMACAVEMAKGIRKTSGACIGVSTTGIAGPGGATRQKPVGLVYVAISTPNLTIARKLLLRGDRNTIRQQTVFSVGQMLLEDKY